jgi:hypothetical protein
MPDDRKPTPLELGLYARAEREPRVTFIEIAAAVLTAIWLLAVIFFGFSGAEEGGGAGGLARSVLAVLAILLPVALIWVAAVAARTARALRREAARLQASIDAMRVAYVEQQQNAALDIKPDLVKHVEEMVAAQLATPEQEQTATFTSMRALTPPETRAAVAAPDPEVPQPALAFAQPEEREPISVGDFIRAMNFPENEHDKEGFRTLRRALEDPATERLVRASQDVLTLLSQDGIYMDDLAPDRARPEIWRRFANGQRGRAVAALGGIHDRSSLVLAAGRMKKDPVFRDAVHHFLRHFDRTFMEFERHASDEEIARLAETRTARAFMLLGRVTGTFD